LSCPEIGLQINYCFRFWGNRRWGDGNWGHRKSNATMGECVN